MNRMHTISGLHGCSGAGLLGMIILLLAGHGRALPSAEGFFTTAPAVRTGYLPEYAFDGDPQTRWAGNEEDKEAWLQADLGEETAIDRLTIRWEAAYAVDYEILLSADAQEWRSLYHEADGKGGEDVIDGLNARGRYLRILCHRPGPHPLYSIWDVSADGTPLGERIKYQAALQREQKAAAEKRLREDLFAAGGEELIFVKRPLYPDGHWYANISYFADDTARKAYAKGGGLYKIAPRTGAVTALIEDPEGTLRDPAVDYDGETILFSWRKGGADSFHLYTIQRDGAGLKQLTDGEYDDIEPAWLPDGGIVFVSSRCRRWVNCWLTQVAIIHRCNRDGSNIIPLSANLEQDNTPWPLPDGRILYTRWEYVDRSQVDYHHLWAMNPDGTGQMTYFGNQHPSGLFIDAKPVPDSDAVIFINSPGHGQREHVGSVALVSPKQGPDEASAIRNITDHGYRDPYPLAQHLFIAARGRDLVLFDDAERQDLLLSIPDAPEGLEVHEPRPLISRSREHRVPPRTDYKQTTGKLILADVHIGRNMEGVRPGEITRLLVLESLPKPINYTGGMDPLTYGGSFTLERVLGTVPVEADGSAYLEAPANRAIFFVALDGQNNSVKRMQSFLSVMPGETLSCVGCHEQRTKAGVNPERRQIKALDRSPSKIEPIPNIPEVFDFPRDIQPILDKHCLACHDYIPHEGSAHGPRSGGVILSGDHGPMFSHSYANLTTHRQFIDGRDAAKSNLAPRSIGAGASPLLHKILGGHHDVRLSPTEMDYIRYWIESGAPYPGTYAALGGGSIGGYFENKTVEDDIAWPSTPAAIDAITRRCLGCHVNENSIPTHMTDENGVSFWRPDDWTDKRIRRSRHMLFNLSRPEYSLVLLAPLAKEAGGYGLCRIQDTTGKEQAVFADSADPDYQKILALCTAGKERLETIKRFDMEGFRPPTPYYREMVRYKVLPPETRPGDPVDYYAADRAYWQSFDQEKALSHPAYTQK